MIAGGVDDAVTAFTCVAARRFASPSCRQLKALSSRFSGSDCPVSEGIRLSGERFITRVDSFQSTSPPSPLGRTPQTPGIYRFFPARMAGFLFASLRAASAAAPCRFRPLNRSLGSHPCVALSHPAQVASVCITQLRRSREKAADITTNPERF